jgi:hypothetical protein
MPNFRHVGHCKDPASLPQSAPVHFIFDGNSGVLSTMVASKIQVEESSLLPHKVSMRRASALFDNVTARGVKPLIADFLRL